MQSRRITAAFGLLVAAALATGCSAESEQTSAPADPDASTTGAPEPAPKTSVAKLKGTLPEIRYYMLDKSCPYCRDIVIVLNGRDPAKTGDPEPLSKTYADRVTFVIKPAFDANYDPDPELEAFGFGLSAHGTVGLLPSGEIAFTMPGHHYGRGALVNSIEAMLKQ